MKKYIAIILGMILILSLVGCNLTPKTVINSDNEATQTKNNDESNNNNENLNQDENNKTDDAPKDEIKIKDHAIFQTKVNKANTKFLVEMHFPTIENYNNNEIFDKINNSITELENSLINNANEFFSDFEEDPNEYPTDLSYNLTYNIALQNNNYISFQFVLYEYFGGTHPDTEPLARTYDLNTGEEITLDKVFNISEEEYKDLIVKYVIEQSKERFKDDDSVVESINEEILKCNIYPNSFYIKDNNLVIFYYSYDFLCYAIGNQEFNIPLDEIKDKLLIDFTDN